MSEIDTNEIRNKLFWADGKPSEAAGDTIGHLCDALDAARDTIKTLNESCSNWEQGWRERNGRILDLAERAEKAEAERDYWQQSSDFWENADKQSRTAIERVRRALDDEIANLADDGARLSHAVVRRIESALAGEVS